MSSEFPFVNQSRKLLWPRRQRKPIWMALIWRPQACIM